MVIDGMIWCGYGITLLNELTGKKYQKFRHGVDMVIDGMIRCGNGDRRYDMGYLVLNELTDKNNQKFLHGVDMLIDGMRWCGYGVSGIKRVDWEK